MIFLLCFMLGSVGSYLVSRYAHCLNLIDVPSARSSHHTPIAKGGGIGLLLAFILVSILYNAPGYFWLPATGLSLLSLQNDRSELSTKVRLFAQFLAGMVLLSGSYLRGGYGFEELFLLQSAIYLLYLVGTANFYNFMDGINGIAGIVGISSFSLLGFYQYESGFCWVSTLCFAMVAACAGFLPFNVPAAKVFMGDVGSILLGYSFAAIVVLTTATAIDFVVMSSFMLFFYLDELTSMWLRLKRKQSLLSPHRSHFYQVLANEAGIAHWKISLGYGIAQFIAGAAILWLGQFGFVWPCVAIACISFTYVKCDLLVRKKFQRS